MKHHRTVSITEFKANCAVLLNQVEKKGQSFTVTQEGRPLVTIGPVKKHRLSAPRKHPSIKRAP